jgi:hypothetical protein
MHVNPSLKIVRMPSNFVAHANGNKRRACREGRGGGGGQAGLVGWGRLGLAGSTDVDQGGQCDRRSNGRQWLLKGRQSTRHGMVDY